MLRTPILPLHQLFELLETDNKEAALLKLWENPLVKEAVFLASPNLYQQLSKWQNGTLKQSKIEKTQLTFLRYFARMTTRSTPFGLFAGYTLLQWEKDTRITLPNPLDAKRSAHINFQHFYELKNLLLRDPALLRQLQFIPNTTFYEFGEQYRFLILSKKKQNYQFSVFSVNKSDHLESVLEYSKTGVGFPKLIEHLLAQGYNEMEASEFLMLLVEKQILVSNLEPSTLGLDYMDSLYQKILELDDQKFAPNTLQIVAHIKNLKNQLMTLDRHSLGLPVREYQDILREMKRLDKSINERTAFRINLKKEGGEGKLSRRVAAAVRRGVRVLNKLRPRNTEDNIARFARRFFARYDQEEVPLLEVFDADIGLDYLNNQQIKDDCPLLDEFPLLGSTANSQRYEWNARERFLLRKVLRAAKENKYEITLRDEELDHFSEDWENLPDSIIAYGSLLNTKSSEEQEPRLLLVTASGPSAINIFSRYSLYDQKLAASLQSIAQAESQLRPDEVLAEVDHLPQFVEGGNVLQRSQLRDYEIPFLTVSHRPIAQQIKLDDIWISYRDGQLVLRSKRLNKRILPRISSTFNFTIDPHPLFQFMGDLHRQGQISSISFRWGRLHQEHRFLPRVNYQNLILCRATWYLRTEDFTDLWSTAKIDIQRVRDWRMHWKIPRYILIQERGDNELFIDLEDESFLQIFKNCGQGSTNIIIKEFLWENDHSPIRDSDGNGYANEFLISFIKKELPNKPQSAPTLPSQVSVTRTFAIGSEWLYYKWYTGTKTAEMLLQKCVIPLCQELLQKKLIDKWFFIRYYDPDYHLRLRFHLPDQEQLGIVLKIVAKYSKDFLASRWIWKEQIDTYQREIERYGEDTILLSESLFFRDSQTILMLLSVVEQIPNGEEMRWQFAFKLIDEYFQYFEYSASEKLALADAMRLENVPKNFAEVLKSRFRKERGILQQLHDEVPNTQIWEAVKPILQIRKKLLVPLALEIKKRSKLSTRDTSTDGLLRSYIHMTINRLCKVNPNQHEYILYEFVYRCCLSQMARQKAKTQTLLNSKL